MKCLARLFKRKEKKDSCDQTENATKLETTGSDLNHTTPESNSTNFEKLNPNEPLTGESSENVQDVSNEENGKLNSDPATEQIDLPESDISDRISQDIDDAAQEKTLPLERDGDGFDSADQNADEHGENKDSNSEENENLTSSEDQEPSVESDESDYEAELALLQDADDQMAVVSAQNELLREENLKLKEDGENKDSNSEEIENLTSSEDQEPSVESDESDHEAEPALLQDADDQMMVVSAQNELLREENLKLKEEIERIKSSYEELAADYLKRLEDKEIQLAEKHEQASHLQAELDRIQQKSEQLMMSKQTLVSQNGMLNNYLTAIKKELNLASEVQYDEQVGKARFLTLKGYVSSISRILSQYFDQRGE